MNKIKQIIPIKTIMDANIDEAYKIFNTYKEKNIIFTSSFDKNKWLVTDEICIYTLNFEIDTNDYKKYKQLLGISRKEFIEKIKIYVLYKLGDYSLLNLQGVLTHIRQLLLINHDELAENISLQIIEDSEKIKEIFILSQNDNNYEEINYLKDQLSGFNTYHITNDNNGRRLLASYDSYTTIGYVLDIFWKECTDLNEKLFYFPLWFWWRISGITPMRPIEIVLTPRKCLKKRNNEWVLTIRKSKKKGTNKKKEYKIDGDYYKYSVIIQDEIANEINWYIEKTKDLDLPDIETLFVRTSHYKQFNMKIPSRSRYYTYVNLNTCLDYFYEYILKDKYGYIIIDDINRLFLNNNEIQKIKLGDTRHLAAINALLEGATASVVKVLLGDENDEVAAHYYSNISKYTEARVYRMKNRMLKGKKIYSIETHEKPLKVKEHINVKNGWCYSPKMNNGSFEDCKNAFGKDGQIGLCEKCFYYRSRNKTFEQSAEIYKQTVKNDANDLKRIVQLYRQGKGNEEDILTSLQKLRNAEKEYANYLFCTGGEDNGKK